MLGGVLVNSWLDLLHLEILINTNPMLSLHLAVLSHCTWSELLSRLHHLKRFPCH